MNLDSRESYFKEQEELMKLSKKNLIKLIRSLYDDVYVRYNADKKDYHRLAVLVLLRKEK